jgi:hypothetical protein
MNMRERIEAGVYNSTGTKPICPPRPIPVFTIGSDVPGSSDYRAYADALDRWQALVNQYEAAMIEWDRHQDQLMQNFARDLAEENGMLGHPKQDVLYQMALKHAHYHTKGLVAVITWYEEFLPLVK